MRSSPLLRVDDMHVRPADGNAGQPIGEILNGFDLTVMPGELHAIVGADGSDTSTLGAILMGSTEYEVTAGSVACLGDDVTDWPVDERAKAGMFLAFHDPQEIAGVSVTSFLRQALSARTGADVSVLDLRLATMDWMTRLGLDSSSVDRYLNDGFTGGERTRNEIMQMALLEPELAILDEPDVGLDIDEVRIAARAIRDVCSERASMGVVLITRSRRLLDEISPDRVHLVVDGRIEKSGGMELTGHLDSDVPESLRDADSNCVLV